MVKRPSLKRLKAKLQTFQPRPDWLPTARFEQSRELSPQPRAYRPTPVGGWPNDFEWDQVAEQHFATAGEEPQV